MSDASIERPWPIGRRFMLTRPVEVTENGTDNVAFRILGIAQPLVMDRAQFMSFFRPVEEAGGQPAPGGAQPE